MSHPSALEVRPNLAEEVADSLRDMIFDGALAGGERINEVHMSRQLGVSRTVLRAALGTLVAEEALVSIPRRGCFVRELTRKEFEELQPIRALLEPAALRLSGIPTAGSFETLERTSETMRATTDMKERVSLDNAWHLELVSRCGNEVLLGLIRHFMHRFRRYGLAFGRERRVLESADREHIEIVRALKAGALDEACELLEKNLTSDKDPILDWLDERSKEKKDA